MSELRLYPDHASEKLEFTKLTELAAQRCKTAYALNRVRHITFSTETETVRHQLEQTEEYRLLLEAGLYLPNDFTQDPARDLRLLSLPGATLGTEQFLNLRKLALNTEQILRWFQPERRAAYPYLARCLQGLSAEKEVVQSIDAVMDERGVVRDEASAELRSIRMALQRKRNELRVAFDRIAARLAKSGYLTDIGESFMNGRRVLAVLAEQKRKVRGVLHAESDSGRTSYIEPEETTYLNNEIFSLDNEEAAEIRKILRALTERLSPFAGWLQAGMVLAGELDFIRAKAMLARDMEARKPNLLDKPGFRLFSARHPLLLLHHRSQQKPTIPFDLTLDSSQRILVISGPNAGGKTVTLKTAGLLQLMVQAGFLIPAAADSEIGLFRQLMIHIGDTQSIEQDLSTYSSHLLHLKHLLEQANGKTLFFIDELGGGTDPGMGGAFAEVILEQLARKKAMGIVTTHYINLKVLAGRTPGLFNGRMEFDETELKPLYRLKTGAPGSSYTFSIAERIGLPRDLIEKARQRVDQTHLKLEQLLNRAERDALQLQTERKKAEALIRKNEQLNREMQQVMNRERHRQEMEKLNSQRKLTEEKIQYLKTAERQLRGWMVQWRKSEDKEAVIRQIQAVLFQHRDKSREEKRQKQTEEKFVETHVEIRPGLKVKMLKNRQVGTVEEIRGKKAVVRLGLMPLLVSLNELVPVVERSEPPVVSAPAEPRTPPADEVRGKDAGNPRPS